MSLSLLNLRFAFVAAIVAGLVSFAALPGIERTVQSWWRRRGNADGAAEPRRRRGERNG